MNALLPRSRRYCWPSSHSSESASGTKSCDHIAAGLGVREDSSARAAKDCGGGLGFWGELLATTARTPCDMRTRTLAIFAERSADCKRRCADFCKKKYGASAGDS